MNRSAWLCRGTLLLGCLLGGCDQGGEALDPEAVEEAKKEIERRERELASVAPGDIEKLYAEATDLFEEGEYREAKYRMNRAYGAFEYLGEKNNLKRVLYLRLLAKLSNSLKENQKTIEYATDVAVFATEDEDKSFAYNLLAGAYSNKGEHAKAIRYYKTSLPFYLKTFGPEHPEVGKIYNNIGIACDAKGEQDEAIDYFLKSLAIDLKTLGREHPSVATTYYNVGTSYAAKGNKAQAMAYLLKAKTIYLKELGLAHPLTKSAQESIDKLKK